MWYTWTPPQNGRVTFRTLGSAFDTLLAVYRGNSLATLTEIASNDDAANASYFTSELTFSANANTRYVIALAGLGEAEGNYVLGWEFVPAAPLVPRIASHPESQTVLAGARVELRVIVENAERVEWWFNSQRLAGATGSTLVLPALNPDQVGTYLAAAVGGGRTNVSHEAIVKVGDDPKVRSYDKLEEVLAPSGAGDAGGAGSGRPAGRARASSTSLGVPALIVSPGRPGLQVINNTNSTTQQREANHCGVKVTRTRWFPVQATAKGYFVIRAMATGVPIPGVNGATFPIAKLPTIDAGRYSVILDNGLGRVTNVVALLPAYGSAVDSGIRWPTLRRPTGVEGERWSLGTELRDRVLSRRQGVDSIPDQPRRTWHVPLPPAGGRHPTSPRE